MRAGLRRLRSRSRNAAAMLRRGMTRHALVVGVTGTAGKSTVTRLVGQILRQRGPTYVASGVNTRDGVKRRYLKHPRGARFWVQEISGHQPGEVAASARFVVPDIAIVTCVQAEHFRAFESLEALADGKADLVRALRPDGIAVLNADDPRVAAMAALAPGRVVTFGIGAGDVRVVNVEGCLPGSVTVTIDLRGDVFSIRTRFAGPRWALHFAAAVAAGDAAGASRTEIVAALETAEPDLYKDSIHRFEDGTLVVLDCFKASFWTVTSSVETLTAINAPRRTFVMGTLSDFRGTPKVRYAEAARTALGSADRVFVYGRNAYRLKGLLAQHGDHLELFETFSALDQRLADSRLPGEAIYVKASGADHLERLMHHRREPVACFADACGVSLRSCNSCKRLYGRDLSEAAADALR
ncbi:Mur ligase family protein [Cereibacter changlensis]|nr:Mur ligase family protein [Cereibacter changlensis]